MSHKRPTADQMNDLISQPHFRRDVDAKETQPSNTPISATPMWVDVDKLVAYDRNPRHAPNDQYEPLKAYIRQNGINQVLTITQRPDTDQPDVYMIGVGGNTRLAIMKDLWQETGDERFKQIHCEYQPWQSEARTLVAHIQDNDLRGDLIFLDRALAVEELRRLFTEQTGESLSQRQLRDLLADQGYQVGQTMIRWYQYTVDTLYPVIPHILQAGMGRPAIIKIYELQQAFFKVWESMALGDAGEAQHLFEERIGRYDDDVLDLKALRRDLEEELSVSADCDMQRASLEIGGALGGRSDSRQAGLTDFMDDVSGRTPPPNSTPDSAPPAEVPEQALETVPETSSCPVEPAHTTAASETHRPAPPATTGGSAGDSPVSARADNPERPARPAEDTQTLPHDLKSLRARTWTLASRIAQGSRLGDIVLPIHDGLGFLVSPVSEDVQQSWHPDIGRHALCAWWQLVTLSEQFARHGQACQVMPPDWADRPIGQAMRQARDGSQVFSRWQWQNVDRALFTDVPPLEPTDMGPMLYQSWNDQRWQDWIYLVETYREIYRVTDGTPWRDQ